jgi:hypothetical protein
LSSEPARGRPLCLLRPEDYANWRESWLGIRTEQLERDAVFRLAWRLSFDAGEEVIMSIAGHVSRAMLSRYSHVRMEAKRRALDEVAARQRAADEKRKKEADQQRQGAMGSQLAAVQ